MHLFTIVSRATNRVRTNTPSKKFVLRCQCGKEITALWSRVEAGRLRHCGCLTKKHTSEANSKVAVSRQTSDHTIEKLITGRGLRWLDQANNHGRRYSYKNGLLVKCGVGHETTISLKALRSAVVVCRLCLRISHRPEC